MSDWISVKDRHEKGVKTMAKEITITCNAQLTFIFNGGLCTPEEAIATFKGLLSKFDDAVVSDVKVFVNDREAGE